MSWSRRIDLIDPLYCSSLVRETSIVEPPFIGFPSFVDEADDLGFPLDLVNPSPPDLFESVTDLIRVEKSPSHCTYQRILRRMKPDLPLKYLCDPFSALECKFDRLVSPKIYDCDRKYKLTKEIKGSRERKYKWEAEIEGPPGRKYKWEANLGGGGGAAAERKYKWEAEIEGPAERKYKWTAEVNGGKKDEKHEMVIVRKAKAAAEAEKKKKKRNYKWTAEIKSEGESGDVSQTYTVKASNGGNVRNSEKEKKNTEKKSKTRVVVIEEEDEPDNLGAIVLRKAFAKRSGAVGNKKGKNKELSPEDAALMIQRAFRAYLIRRSKALRALRDLAVSKTKLKEIRALFRNFKYRRLIDRDAEEHQKFSERIIVLLLTVDAIEGVDLMIRAAKRSMVDELEAMLDAVDPHPQTEGKSLSMRRRTFDMPDSVIRKEIADGVTQIVQMLESEE